MKVNGIELTEISCAACSHWSFNNDDTMFCQFYGKNCTEVKECPVRSLDNVLAQKRLAWTIIRIIAQNRQFVMRGNSLLTPKNL